mmetsp:Transcript_2813/g.5212  ORF Transcript_2813/g.5212 Transcript_2813/m.5212 type:complete len:265 (+) Transcript_2813:1779-2573(+)
MPMCGQRSTGCFARNRNVRQAKALASTLSWTSLMTSLGRAATARIASFCHFARNSAAPAKQSRQRRQHPPPSARQHPPPSARHRQRRRGAARRLQKPWLLLLQVHPWRTRAKLVLHLPITSVQTMLKCRHRMRIVQVVDVLTASLEMPRLHQSSPIFNVLRRWRLISHRVVVARCKPGAKQLRSDVALQEPPSTTLGRHSSRLPSHMLRTGHPADHAPGSKPRRTRLGRQPRRPGSLPPQWRYLPKQPRQRRRSRSAWRSRKLT